MWPTRYYTTDSLISFIFLCFHINTILQQINVNLVLGFQTHNFWNKSSPITTT